MSFNKIGTYTPDDPVARGSTRSPDCVDCPTMSTPTPGGPSRARDVDRRLTRLLRHEGGHLPMDAAGWVPVDLILRRFGLDRPTLEALVASNNKQRLQLDGERIRCCQGHSTEGMPVTCDALEASWTAWPGPEILWHGTSLAALEAIDLQGLLPQARTHVHLAEATNSTVGKRAQVDVLLAVDPTRLAGHGLGVWRAPNGVLLVRRVPRDAIVGIRPATRAAEAQRAELTRRFGPA